ncbi:ComEC family competence protein [Planctomycetes bacterium CA13]|uniref:ComEC family competence protein n=1 Tax=Novipirellula herctigrandis TaxID=2527986 RepID=A0A5C5YWU0_9BACT|nr:ComEC family competence protein [Planctomycetes bacterium CA13]
MKIKLTVIVENTARGVSLLGEHGLAVWIDYGEKHVLFDTGQGKVLASNARKLGLPLSKTDAVVLSHGHYDHTGGLADVIEQNTSLQLFAHPQSFHQKFSQKGNSSARDVGIPKEGTLALNRLRRPYVATAQPTRVYGGLMVTGTVPKVTDFENEAESFYLDKDCQCRDPLVDDQSMFFDTTEGVVVLLGCAHAGVINTLRYIQKLTEHRPIAAVFGGMHLINASKQRIEATVKALQSLQPKIVGPAHCTGDAATGAIWCAMPDQCVGYHVGSKFEFEEFAKTNLSAPISEQGHQ